MTTRSLLASGLLLISATSAMAASDAAKQAGTKLLEAMREEVDQKPEGAGEDRQMHPSREYIVEAMERALENENGGRYDSSWIPNFKSPAVKEAAKAYAKALATEKDDLLKEKKENLKALLAKAKETVEKAQEPSDLDGPIEELQQRNSNYSDYGDIQDAELVRLGQRVQRAAQFLNQWQDYLAAKKRGDAQQIQSTLANMISYGGSESPGLIPRSRLIEMRDSQSGKPADPVTLILEIRSLDGMRDVLSALRKTRNSDSNYGSGSESLVSNLVSLEKSYRDYLAGIPISLELSQTSYSDNRSDPQAVERIASLRAMLIKLVVPRYIDAPKDTVAKPDETAEEFLERIVEEAKAKEDADLAYRAREARKILTRGNTYNSQDVTGMNAWNSGQNQEKAGQFVLAVISYQGALKSGSDLVPAVSIGKRLDAIKAEHPEDYEKGMAQFLAPVDQSFPRFPQGYRGPGEQQRQQQGGPAILIPAPKSEEAAPKKEPAASTPKTEEKKEGK